MDKETKQRIIDETVEWLYIKCNNGEMEVPNIKQFTEDYQAYMSYIE
jgi:acyl carrier protein